MDEFARLFARELPAVDLVAYVFRSVRNSAIDLTRTSNRQTSLKDSLFNGYHQPANRSVEPTDELMIKERCEQLRDALEQLPEQEREAVILKSFAELTFEQAGSIANVPSKTIATRYRRALAKLETQLKHEI